nr:MAG TPA: PBZ domain protein [Caudoviricetes sp.]DAV03540.1 MAG TPA: PBZ domain protein [Caudoviricetes sp.]
MIVSIFYFFVILQKIGTNCYSKNGMPLQLPTDKVNYFLGRLSLN